MRRWRVFIAMACFIAAAAPAQAGLAARTESFLGQTAAQLRLPRSLWCADFMNMLLGRPGGDRRALSYVRYGTPAAYGCTDCIAVVRSHRWHVGVVKTYDANGNPVIVSGNHGRRVGIGAYPRRSVLTYRNP